MPQLLILKICRMVNPYFGGYIMFKPNFSDLLLRLSNLANELRHQLTGK